MKLFKLGMLSLCMLGLFGGALNAASYKVPKECMDLKATDAVAYKDCVKTKGTKVETPSMDPAAPADPATVEVMDADDDSGE